jgi:hypothetical protein
MFIIMAECKMKYFVIFLISEHFLNVKKGKGMNKEKNRKADKRKMGWPKRNALQAASHFRAAIGGV